MASRTFATILTIALAVPALVQAQPELTAEQRQLIDAAVPATAPAKPKQPRTLLIFTLEMRNGARAQGPSYPALPAQNYAFEQMGKRTGAFNVVVSDDIEMFRPGNIQKFDAICFCNSLGVLFDDPELKKSLLDFVASGKGLVGIHDAIATFVQYPQYDQWPEFGRMLGGTENGGHPWDGVDMTVHVEDRDSPLTAMFSGESVVINDQAMQLQEPTFRDRLRVLMTVDPSRTPAPRRIFSARQQDQDFPVSWIKRHGQGRVFYTFLGHYPRSFWDKANLAHMLAGIQYAMGDLQADDTPRPQPKR